MSTSAMQVFLFKDSYEPFTALLQESDVKFNELTPPVGVPMNASFTIELLHTVQSPAFCTAVSAVICAFLKYRASRKVIITTHDNKVIHAEGLSQSDLERVIENTKSIAAIETVPPLSTRRTGKRDETVAAKKRLSSPKISCKLCGKNPCQCKAASRGRTGRGTRSPKQRSKSREKELSG